MTRSLPKTCNINSLYPQTTAQSRTPFVTDRRSNSVPPIHNDPHHGVRRHTEQNLTERESVLSEIDPDAVRIKAQAFEAVSEAVVFTDAAQRIVLVNPAFETITGYTLPEIRGRTCALLQGPLSDAATVRDMGQALRQQGSFAGQIFNYRKDGSTFWNDLSISSLHDTQGKLTHFIGLMRDVSQRVRAETALQEAEARYRNATEAAGGYILDIDTEFRYTFVSQGAERLLGYACNEMLGRTPAEFMPPGELERVNAWFNGHQQEDGSIQSLEHRVVAKSGDIRWLQVARTPLQDSQGRHMGYRGIAFDITARKQAEMAQAEKETQTRESQKMEAIGTLAGGIAHDFNNIIAAILGNVSLALQDVSPDSPAVHSLEEIDKAASRARDLVRQILAFSRRQNTEYERIDLQAVVNDTARMLRTMLPTRIAIDTDCAEGTPDVSADSSQIQQAILNLATNAMQAIGDRPGRLRIGLGAPPPDEPTLSKHPALRALHEQHPEGLVRLTVSDDGPGMEQAILSRIFEPFFTTRPVGEGTGLGLAVVHGIAQGHNGLIVVDSELGTGSRFALYLPSHRVHAHPAPEIRPLGANKPRTDQAPMRTVTAANAGAPGPHIVYLDDDESLLILVKRLLERRGYRVSAHDDQQSALKDIQADPAGIDLLLTDYNMPGMSGLDVARKALAIRADLPVAITSGFIDEKLSAEAASTGIHKLIFKAVAVDEFCAAIAELLPVGH